MNEKEKVNQITDGVIWKQLLLFFFPIVFGTFFQQIYNTADTIVVGRFVGKQALAAVGGSASQIANLIVGFFVGLSSGAAVVISQFYGAKDKKNVGKALHTAFAFFYCCRCGSYNCGNFSYQTCIAAYENTCRCGGRLCCLSSYLLCRNDL